jgi:hypothetical protein
LYLEVKDKAKLLDKIALHQRFFEAAKLDLEAAKVLTDKNLCQPAIYHLQQAFEKCIKSYFIFKEVNINNKDEDTVYDAVTKLSHKTETSTIILLKDMADMGLLSNSVSHTVSHLFQVCLHIVIC